MPIPVLILFFVLLIAISITAFAERQHNFGMLCIIIIIALSGWVYQAYLSVGHKEGTAKVVIVDNIATANIDGDIKNLNKYFKRQLSEDNVVKYKKYDEFSYGILVLIETQMEIE